MNNSLPSIKTAFKFANLQFYIGTMRDAVSIIDRWIVNKKKTYVCVTGVHGVAATQDSPGVFKAFSSADLIVPDGMPIVWVGKLCGHKDTRRIYGPDLFFALCDRAQKKQWRIYLYGTTDSTLEKLVDRVRKKFPRLVIAGMFSPPVHPLTQEVEQKVIQRINQAHAHIVFIGISTPKQEMWMHAVRDQLNANVLIGVGAAFDFISNSKPQAPPWVRQVGLEWLFRLVHEPARLWRRYVNAIWIFPRLLYRHFFRV